jgi:Asp-tRNA(Asn)/Glu-tRNA(Gln) amidotransferase C subunit
MRTSVKIGGLVASLAIAAASGWDLTRRVTETIKYIDTPQFREYIREERRIRELENELSSVITLRDAVDPKKIEKAKAAYTELEQSKTRYEELKKEDPVKSYLSNGPNELRTAMGEVFPMIISGALGLYLANSLIKRKR